MADDAVPFPYMRYAKTKLTSFGGMNLGMSGIAGPSPAELDVPRDTPFWAPEGEYGDPVLRAAIAAHLGVGPERVFVSAGSSLANFLVYLTQARGAHVAVETPVYEALTAVAQAVGASVSTFRREEATGWRIDPASLAAAVTPSTRLLVVTDLHNPSGARLHPDDLALLVRHAERVDGAVLVDEVYLELDLLTRPTAASSHPRILVTSSLTKSHGLGGLRIGWILADPARIARIAAWNDLICPAHPVPSIAIAKAYLARAPEFLARTKAMVAQRLATTDRFIASRRDVSWVRPAGGITGLVRLPAGVDSVAFGDHAWTRHGVRVIPGAFFGAPHHVRISYGLPAADLERALVAFGRALDGAPRAPSS